MCFKQYLVVRVDMQTDLAGGDIRGEFPAVVHRVKDLELSLQHLGLLLRCRLDPSPRNLHLPSVQPKKKKKTLEAEATTYRDQAKDGAFMSAHATRKRWLELLDISTNISLEEYAGVVVKSTPSRVASWPCCFLRPCPCRQLLMVSAILFPLL